MVRRYRKYEIYINKPMLQVFVEQREFTNDKICEINEILTNLNMENGKNTDLNNQNV